MFAKMVAFKKGFAVGLGLSAYAGSTVLYAPAFDHLLSSNPSVLMDAEDYIAIFVDHVVAARDVYCIA